jgi:methyl-accepting chemotaxis protein
VVAFVKNLPVGRKLYLSFGCILALLAATVAAALWSQTQQQAAPDRLARVIHPKLAAGQASATAFTDMHFASANEILDPSLHSDYADDENAFLAELHRIDVVAATRAEKRNAARIRARFDDFHRLETKAIALARHGHPVAATAVVGGPADEAGDAVSEAIDAVIQSAVHDQDASFAAAKHSETLGRVVVLTLGGLALLLAAAMVFFLTRSIRRPLQRVKLAAEAAAAGDLTVDVEPESKDEIGAVAAAFQQLVENLRRTISTLQVTAGQLGSSSQQMASTSDEAGRAVGEIARAMSGVAEGAEHQVRTLDSVKHLADEMAAAVEASAADAEETARVAVQARTVAADGGEAVSHATEAMRVVRESSVAVTDAIRRLGDKSGQIVGIVETITGIAGQTNLLALNAAIEAARAGEQGRGFAVVAEEVRKLAEESQRAAASIASLIDEIQGETQRAVEVVETGARETETGTETVEQAREAFERIGLVVEDVSGRVEAIASRIRGVSAGSVRVKEEMSDVAAVAEQSSAATEQVSASGEQTSASTQEIASSARELAATAEQLNELVAQFRIAA